MIVVGTKEVPETKAASKTEEAPETPETKETAPQVRISTDEMEAFLYLPMPAEENYTIEELEAALREKGIVHGVNMAVLEQMLESRLYHEEFLVAEGTPVLEGVEGYFEYHFNRVLDGRPKILPDGTVDYWSIQKVEIVKEGQLIATYHPAIQGRNGMTVTGKQILVKHAREMSPIKGKGFTRSEDNLTYTADFEGKIEMQNDRIVILKVYEISGDADLSVGNIDFNGDVIIHGNVRTGVSIKAGGNLTVDGIAEAAQLWAGKDIVLRGGMMGESKGKVFAKGDISAKFFEYVQVEAIGNIQAEVFLNCQVICMKKILLEGKKAGIIGGSVCAIQGIAVGNIGNEVEINTEVRVGNDVKVFRRIRELHEDIRAKKELLAKLEKGLSELARLEEAQAIKNDDPRKGQLLRVKVREAALMGVSQAELDKLNRQVESGRDARIRVERTTFPGVRIVIDDIRYHVREEQWHMEYRNQEGEVVASQLVS